MSHTKTMIAVIHQTYFLPWLGYFNKLAYADNFVVLDNVFYRKQYFDNRTHIKDMHGNKRWLTLPVGENNEKPANEVYVDPSFRFNRIYRIVRQSYEKTNYYHLYWPLVQQAMEEGYPHLLTINLNIIKELLAVLGLTDIKITYSSEIYAGTDPTERLICLCQATGSTKLILGEGGSYEYHDLTRIRSAGIVVAKQQFVANHPVYAQIRGPFIERLSTIDALFNIGAEKTLEIIRNAWSPNREFLTTNSVD